MANKLRILIAQTFDPWFNLATEEWIFKHLDPTVHTLFLWRNQATVVIGRSQNPWAECNIQAMAADGVILARRSTGGGAVYQDLGNTNFTFLNSQANYNKHTNTKIITDALAQFNVKSYASGRNDIVMQHLDGSERKISGSAYRETKDRAFHHGTLLVNVDLSKLQQYLTPKQKKLQAKGVKSVRSRVINLAEYNDDVSHERICDAIITTFCQHYQAECAIEYLDPQHLQHLPELDELYNHYKNWHWRYGKTLEFTHHLNQYFSWGSIDLHLQCHQGKITNVQIFTDGLQPEIFDDLAMILPGTDYAGAAIAHKISSNLPTDSILAQNTNITNDLKNWLVQEI
jgi:lipoate-protein ligase A